MQTQTITTYNFNELNEKAKEYALNKNRELCVSDNWYADTFADAEEFGVRISTFDLDRAQKIGGEFVWSEIEVADLILDNCGETTEMYKVATNFKKERDELCNSWEYIDGAPVNEEKLEDELNVIENKFEKDILWQYWKILRNEYEYLFSDEFLADHFENNEYQFTENGKIYNF